MPECNSCGRSLAEEDKHRTWKVCPNCGEPVCFNCVHYRAVGHADAHGRYVTVVGLCAKCFPSPVLRVGGSGG
ncbi:MAG TPA: hypothetical protein EYP43_01315 [Thermoplasmata archaeon]|nr:hypothetical protein [Thermoplasmata archaeon]